MVKQSAEVRGNADFMRKLKNICSQLPISSKESFDKNAFYEYSDIAAINLMASVTKGFEMINELVDDFSSIQK